MSWVAAPVAAILLMLLGAAAPANAVDLTIQSCAQGLYDFTDESSDAGWSRSKTSGPLVPKGTCPSGLSFDTSTSVPLGTTSYWAFYVVQRPQSTGVKLTIDGGDQTTGFRYSIAGCEDCSSIYDVPDDRDGTEGATTLTFDSQSIQVLTVRAKCVLDPCLPATPLSFHNVRLGVRDVDAPKVSQFSNWSGWQKRANVGPSLSVDDWPGVGLNYATLWADGSAPIWTTGSMCSLLYGIDTVKSTYGRSELCSPIPYSPGASLNLAGLKDGPHALSVTAVDGVDNTTTVPGPTMKLDDTLPEAPEDIAPSDVDEGGWTAKDKVNFTMTFPATDPAAGAQAPLSKLSYVRKQVAADAVLSNPIDTYPTISVLPKVAGFTNVAIPTDGTWTYWFWATDDAGNAGSKGKITVKRDRTTPQPPVIAATTWVNRNDLIAGYSLKILSQDLAGIESGICSYLVTTNATEQSLPLVTAPKVKTPVTELPLPASTPATDKWAHVRSVSCSGLASDAATNTALHIDDTAPVVDAAGIPEGGWIKTPPTVTVSATDADSGVKSVSYRIDAGAPTTVQGSSTTFTIPPGDHTLRYWANDNARNATSETVQKLAIDAVGPQVSFDPRDAEYPARISGKAADAASGIVDARIEYRRIDQPDPAWHDLPTAAVADATDPKSLVLSATIPDADLPAGEYAFQITAADAAGNRTNSELIGVTGVQMRATLPLRAQNQITVALAKIVKKCNAKKTACKSDFDIADARKTLSTGLGRRIAVVGELRDKNGGPLAGRPLTIFSEIGDHGRAKFADATTDATGKFRVNGTADASSRLIATFAATDQELEASSSAELRVAAKAKLKVNRRVVHAGQTLKFSGELLGSPSGFSRAKVPVVLEFLNGSTPQTGIGRTKTDLLGNFQVPGYKWKTVPKQPYVLKVRAAITAGSTLWPFDDGYSNWVSISVRR